MTTKTVTYGQLENALTRLGFVQTFRGARHTLFEYAATGAQILLPLADPDKIVEPIQLYTARRTNVENGIADEETFEALLSQPLEHVQVTQK